MTSGPLRLAIIAALAVVGVLVLTQGFPTITQANVPQAVSGDGGVSQPSSPQQTKQQKPPKASNTPSPSAPGDVSVAVYNGTTTPNLASDAIDQLGGEYKFPFPPDNTPDQNETTTVVYYRDAQGKIDATALAQKLVKGAEVQHLPATATQVPKDADLVVYLGSDYAAAQH